MIMLTGHKHIVIIIIIFIIFVIVVQTDSPHITYNRIIVIFIGTEVIEGSPGG